MFTNVKNTYASVILFYEKIKNKTRKRVCITGELMKLSSKIAHKQNRSEVKLGKSLWVPRPKEKRRPNP